MFGTGEFHNLVESLHPMRVSSLVGMALCLCCCPTRQAVAQPLPIRSSVEHLLHAGRYSVAMEQIRSARTQEAALTAPLAPRGTAASVAEFALLAALISNAWAPAEFLDADQLNPKDASSYWYIRGTLFARWAWPGGIPEHLAVAREAATQLEALAAGEGTFSRSDVRRTSVLAAIAGALEERDELTLLLSHAQHLDNQLAGAGWPDDPLLPIAELAGDLWLRIHRYDDAERYYRAAIARFPTRTRAWVGAARAARDAGRVDAARADARQVLSMWAQSEDAALAEMQALAAALP